MKRMLFLLVFLALLVVGCQSNPLPSVTPTEAVVVLTSTSPTTPTSAPTLDSSGQITFRELAHNGEITAAAAYDAEGEPAGLYLADKEDELHLLDENGINPAWSPDGTVLGYRTGTTVCVYDSQTKVTYCNSNLQSERPPVWQGDGTLVGIVDGNLVALNTIDSVTEPFIVNLMHEGAWETVILSRDGELLGSYWEEQLHFPNVVWQPADFKSASTINDATLPKWSDEGNFYYVRVVETSEGLYHYDTETLKSTQLFNEAVTDYAVSPDGTKVAFGHEGFLYILEVGCAGIVDQREVDAVTWVDDHTLVIAQGQQIFQYPIAAVCMKE